MKIAAGGFPIRHLSLKPLCCFRLKSKHRDLPICYKNKRCGIVPLRKPEIFMLFCIITRLSEKRKVKLSFAHFKLYVQLHHDMQDPLFIEIIPTAYFCASMTIFLHFIFSLIAFKLCSNKSLPVPFPCCKVNTLPILTISPSFS